MADAPPQYGSREWFLQQGEPEWRTSHNQGHVIGVVGDVSFTNDRWPQLTAGPSTVYGTAKPNIHIALDHRLTRPQHASDGVMGLQLTPLSAMGFAAELFALAHSQYVVQLGLDTGVLP